MSDIRVILVDASYAQVLSTLGRRLFAETFGPDNAPTNMEAYLDESYTPEIQEKELNDPNVNTFMAFDEHDVPVGFCQLRQSEKVYDFIGDSEAIELQRIYVDKNCAGKGIGGKLMSYCIAKARELNKKTMWLGVWEFNPTAIKFYTNKGFYKVGTHVFKVGDQEDTDNVMILKL
ncbi:acyl-CoA N-acyltransferase [Parasitella parasitica]|nr:acyl-CoA N-acyltransferase [Parasitella parasitica]